jgi:ribA/ribD-fused uncharacterized protein
MTEPIYFYDPDEDWGFLSNMSFYGFDVEGRIWRTAEHYYQAHKFVQHKELFLKIAGTKDPFEAKSIAADNADKCPQGWYEDGQAQVVMRAAIREKFKQNTDIARQLKETGNSPIIERSDADGFWGDGEDGLGQNWAGKILMEVRNELNH